MREQEKNASIKLSHERLGEGKTFQSFQSNKKKVENFHLINNQSKG